MLWWIRDDWSHLQFTRASPFNWFFVEHRKSLYYNNWILWYCWRDYSLPSLLLIKLTIWDGSEACPVAVCWCLTLYWPITSAGLLFFFLPQVQSPFLQDLTPCFKVNQQSQLLFCLNCPSLIQGLLSKVEPCYPCQSNLGDIKPLWSSLEILVGRHFSVAYDPYAAVDGLGCIYLTCRSGRL